MQVYSDYSDPQVKSLDRLLPIDQFKRACTCTEYQEIQDLEKHKMDHYSILQQGNGIKHMSRSNYIF